MTGRLVPRVMWGTSVREVHSDLKVLTEILVFLGPQVWWGSEDSRADRGWSDQLANQVYLLLFQIIAFLSNTSKIPLYQVKPGSRGRMGRTESPGPAEYPD